MICQRRSSTSAARSFSPPPHVTISSLEYMYGTLQLQLQLMIPASCMTQHDIQWAGVMASLINTAQRPNSQPWLWLLPTPAFRVCTYWLGWLTSAAMLVLRVISHCVHTHTHRERERERERRRACACAHHVHTCGKPIISLARSLAHILL